MVTNLATLIVRCFKNCIWKIEINNEIIVKIISEFVNYAACQLKISGSVKLHLDDVWTCVNVCLHLVFALMLQVCGWNSSAAMLVAKRSDVTPEGNQRNAFVKLILPSFIDCRSVCIDSQEHLSWWWKVIIFSRFWICTQRVCVKRICPRETINLCSFTSGSGTYFFI